MATYVLVHGAWGGAYGWNDVAERLIVAGHRVHVVGLTGLGERDHLLSPAITLSTHVADVAQLIDHRALANVILVGHSYGGMVVTGVAGRVAERLRAIVYVDAFVPRDGEALWDLADDASRAFYLDGQRDVPGLVAPPPQTDFRPRPLGRHPLLTLTEPVATGGRETALPRTYVYATRDAPTVFTQFHARLKDDPAWRVHVVPTGHMVMFDDPDGLVAILLEEAGRGA